MRGGPCVAFAQDPDVQGDPVEALTALMFPWSLSPGHKPLDFNQRLPLSFLENLFHRIVVRGFLEQMIRFQPYGLLDCQVGGGEDQ